MDKQAELTEIIDEMESIATITEFTLNSFWGVI